MMKFCDASKIQISVKVKKKYYNENISFLFMLQELNWTSAEQTNKSLIYFSFGWMGLKVTVFTSPYNGINTLIH